MAFFVPSLAASQLAYTLIKNVNTFYQQGKHHGVDIAVFYENIATPILKPNFATANVVDAWNYNGCLVSTTLSTAFKAMRFPRSTNFFYVFDLEWVGLKNKQYELLAEIYQSDRLKLLARSPSHAKAISNAWVKPVEDIVENININSFLEVVKNYA